MSEPAFPMVVPTQFYFAHSGLIRREWFAGQSVLAAVTMAMDNGPVPPLACDVAKNAFALADAMIEAGKEKP